LKGLGGLSPWGEVQKLVANALPESAFARRNLGCSHVEGFGGIFGGLSGLANRTG